MDQQAVLAGLMENQQVHQGREGKSQTACGQIAGAKIADRGKAGAFGHQGGHAQPQRGRMPPFRFVPDRLPWTTDAQDFG